ncbi:MAG TPA: tRNA (adenosine(37)-N6)-threonylcarbamoyltransferase complex ATPase subunit type 1 TsaE [Terrimicrobiaceae bacterium]
MANRKPLFDALFSRSGVVCRTPEETVCLGEEVSALLERGNIVSLEGPLGAGKTQLVKGIAAALGCVEEASSPSFTLVHEYSGGRYPLYHFDFYRLENVEELYGVGYDDCLAAGGVVVEWGDKFPEALPPGTIRLNFEILPKGRRIRGFRVL